jgi:hypothetical protein
VIDETGSNKGEAKKRELVYLLPEVSSQEEFKKFFYDLKNDAVLSLFATFATWQ